VIPQRARVMGIDVPTAGLRVVLPLPSLPRESSLTSVSVVADAITIAIRIPMVDEPLSPDMARRLRPLLAASRVGTTGGANTHAGAPAGGRLAQADLVRAAASGGRIQDLGEPDPTGWHPAERRAQALIGSVLGLWKMNEGP
jgi:hypothetical protein